MLNELRGQNRRYLKLPGIPLCLVRVGYWDLIEPQDILLLNAVKAFGTNSWDRVAEVLTEHKRSAKGCQNRWMKKFDPNIRCVHLQGSVVVSLIFVYS